MTPRAAVMLNQLPTVVAVAMVLFFTFTTHPERPDDGDAWLWVGTGIIVCATAAAFTVRWETQRFIRQLLIPAANLVGLCVIAIAGHYALAGLSVLLALPYFWFAWARVVPTLTRIGAVVIPSVILHLQQRSADDGTKGLDHYFRPALIPILILAFTIAIQVVSSTVAAENRKFNEALAKSEERRALLNGILNAANVGVVVTDAGGHDVLRNRQQDAIHELVTPEDHPDPTEAELLLFGEDRVTPIPPEQRPVRRAVTGEEFDGQLIWAGPSGLQRAYSVSARTQRAADGAAAAPSRSSTTSRTSSRPSPRGTTSSPTSTTTCARR
ncbi:hypothetical protein ACQ3I4_12560 [Zafaria sp. Z1313]|uniref:hypothetical protein n=1 Tax=unclassified Zafaria TaxID=2828765 RepID=UPI002E78FE72|nr:hypothetical protein [Zafaria sp. J156]MEE1620513.1 hypothetical protein [Zafaria sp. J156]